MSPLGSFWSEFYKSFKGTGGYVTGILGLLLAIWSVLFPTPFNLDGRWIIGTIIVAYMTCAPFADLASRSHQAVARRPRVRHVVSAGDQIIVLVSPGASFGADTAAVIYQIDQGIELEVGVGRATRQLDADAAQILVVDTRGKDELWRRLCGNEPGLKETLAIRSALPFDTYQRLGVQ